MSASDPVDATWQWLEPVLRRDAADPFRHLQDSIDRRTETILDRKTLLDTVAPLLAEKCAPEKTVGEAQFEEIVERFRRRWSVHVDH